MKRSFLYPFLFGWAFSQAPFDWTVNSADYEHFMTMTSVLTVNLQEMSDTNNVIGAFHGTEVRGVSSRQIVNDRTYHFIQIYGNTGDGEITFKAFEAEHSDSVLNVTDTLDFVAGASHGDPQDPYIFQAVNNSMPPVAIVDAPNDAREGRLVTVFGDASWCSMGGALTYQWSADPSITLDSTTSSVTTFTVPLFDRDTVLAVYLEVTNPMMTSEPDTGYIYIMNNLAPVAMAGDSQYVFPNTTVHLDGSYSYDPEDDSLSFSWTGPSDITFSDASIANPTFTAPQGTHDRAIELVLTASDYELASTPDTVVVMVSNNTPPDIVMIYPTEVLEGDSVHLDGSGTSDVQDDPITYYWLWPDIITLSDTTTHSASFATPSIDADTTLEILFGAWDGQYGSIDSIRVLVRNNQVPIADAGEDFTLREGRRAELNAYFSVDPDARPLSFYWRSLSGITLTDTSGQIIYFDAPAISNGQQEFLFELGAYDGVDYGLDTIGVTVINNMRPVARAGSDIYMLPNVAGQLNGSGSYDMEMDSISFRWTSPASIVLSDSTAISPTFTSPNWDNDTSVVITLTVSDYFETSATDTVILNVVSDRPPIADAGEDQMVRPGTLVTLDGSDSYDPEGVAINHIWSNANGVVLSDTSDTNPTFTAADYGMDSVLTFSLVVSDGNSQSTPDEVQIKVFSNYPPIADAGNDTTVIEGRSVVLDGSNSSDPEGVTITYLWRVLSGAISGTANQGTQNTPSVNIEIISDSTESTVEVRAPYVVDSEVFFIELKVSDSVKIARDTVLVMVTNNRVPIADAGDDMEMKEGQTVYLNGNNSSDPDGAPLTYDWITPDGIHLNNVAIATPNFVAPLVSADTTYELYLRVNDGDFWSKKDTMQLTVLDNILPIADAGTDRVGLSGSVIQLDGTLSSDADGDALTYAWASLADSIVLSNERAEQPEFLAPIVSASTPYTFTLTVSDGGGTSDPDSVTITIEPVADVVRVTDPGTTPVTSGDGIPITVTIPNDVVLQDATLLYAQGGDDTMTEVSMSESTGESIEGVSLSPMSIIYTGLIPHTHVSERGLVYRVELTDVMGAVHKLAQKQITVAYTDGQVSTEKSYSGYPEGLAAESWKMISFPGHQEFANIGEILGLSGFDQDNYDEDWKLWSWAANEWIDPAKIKPGTGYWFNHRSEGSQHLALKGGMSVDLNGFEFLLKPGWNLVGSPYTFPVKVVLDQKKLIGPYEYQNDYDGWAKDFPSVWEPFRGYAIYNATNETVPYFVDPFIKPTSNGNGNIRTKGLPPDSWSMDLVIQSNGRIDENNIFGAAITAADGIDGYDHPEPPDVTPRTTLSFTSVDGNVTTRNFKSMNGGQSWDAKLILENGLESATIKPNMDGSMPAAWKAVIINKNENRIVPLDGREIAVSSGNGEVALAILAGDDDYIAEGVSAYQINIPTAFALEQNYPNPFNPSTQIQYDVATQGQIKILVYDILGRQIRTLVNDHRIPGAYRIKWDGKDNFGSPVAAGMYLYQFTGPGFVKTKKMVVLK